MQCPSCHQAIPDISRYCLHCGVLLRSEDPAAPEEEEQIDWETRVLCSDGTCTGTIVDGKCTVCAKPHPPAA